MRFRAGDAVNTSIGQGDTVVTPLQMAMVYAAIANGGTVYEPRIAKAIMNADGSIAEKIEPVVKSKLPISNATLKYIQKSLKSTTVSGTGAPPFVGFPLSRIPVATKTGTGEVLGKQSTSWFASYAPADNPQYAIVMMVAQGGTGSGTSAPSVRRIYEELFGIRGSTIDPATSILKGGAPTSALTLLWYCNASSASRGVNKLPVTLMSVVIFFSGSFVCPKQKVEALKSKTEKITLRMKKYFDF
jgi:penicillin-binding protein 2